MGVYYYVVKEVKGTASRVTYDTTVYNITVNVSNNNGVLEKEVIYKVGDEVKTEISFRNTYRKPDPQPQPLDIDLNVEKIMKGRYDVDGFVFELVAPNGTGVDTAVSDRDGEAVLHVGTFYKADAGKTLYFIVREADTGVPGVIYSTKEYEVRITLYYDSTSNRMGYELVKDGAVVDGEEPFVFTNIYTPGGGDKEDPKDPARPTSPDTGDEGIGFWIMLLSVGAAGFAATLLAMIRRRRSA